VMGRKRPRRINCPANARQMLFTVLPAHFPIVASQD